MPSFGEIISEKRKEIGISQKELSAQIVKEDGQPISPQYLNDLERDRRNVPDEYLIEQFSKVLLIPAEQLYYCAGELAPDMKEADVDEDLVLEAYTAFRKVINKQR
ncbi:MAG: helix-turn-helix transcriptional regulator [Armatimonadetes bacterium]|nr:helix-turn-helix transcriptional regulator [Armatimonadota bacterium]